MFSILYIKFYRKVYWVMNMERYHDNWMPFSYRNIWLILSNLQCCSSKSDLQGVGWGPSTPLVESNFVGDSGLRSWHWAFIYFNYIYTMNCVLRFLCCMIILSWLGCFPISLICNSQHQTRIYGESWAVMTQHGLISLKSRNLGCDSGLTTWHWPWG